jgi:hypothetical protein
MAFVVDGHLFNVMVGPSTLMATSMNVHGQAVIVDGQCHQ